MKTLVQILGCSFCGSTYTGMVLGALDGVGHIGESHWSDDPRDLGCWVCQKRGLVCPVITQEAKREAKNAGSRWYAAWAEILGVDVIVSGDKIPINYEGKMSGCLRIPLVLFRSPEGQVASNKTHTPGRDSFEAVASLHHTQKIYEDIVTSAETSTQGIESRPPIFLDFDHFLSAKRGVLAKLCEMIGVSFREDALRYWNFAQHTIGGNDGSAGNPYEPFIDKTSPLERPVDYRWKSILSTDELRRVRSHPYNDLWLDMMKRSQENFKS